MLTSGELMLDEKSLYREPRRRDRDVFLLSSSSLPLKAIRVVQTLKRMDCLFSN
jgi:hypothetical protein